LLDSIGGRWIGTQFEPFVVYLGHKLRAAVILAARFARRRQDSRGGDVMTFGKMTALSLGFVGAFALGVWTGPTIVHRSADAVASHDASVIWGSGLPPETEAASNAAAPRAAATAARVDASAPDLQVKLKPVLNRGANMALAAEGFNSAEQFATVAHAARNTQVPFVLLKHRVINEGKSVAEAIRESKPAVNAAVEANLARAQARSDIASIAG
jgi:hypothetical protein